MKLTIGMATYNDFDGMYFSVQSLRMYHDLTDSEVLVVDNKGDKKIEDWCKGWGVRYEKYTEVEGTTQSRQRVFDLANGEHVICIDSHVMLFPGALERLWDDDSLIHGPMAYDNLVSFTTHMEDRWRSNMWGTWAKIVKNHELPKEPFEIPMHGLGLFGCRKDSWLGLNRQFKGFGGEEGYIHTKFKQVGRKVLCLPWMKWCHRFNTSGTGYRLDLKDRVRNYLLGFSELGLDPQPVYDEFGSIARYVERKINDETTSGKRAA